MKKLSKISNVIVLVFLTSCSGEPRDDSSTNNLNILKNSGLLIHFLELDMTVNKDKILTTFTTERLNAQKLKYKQISTCTKPFPKRKNSGLHFGAFEIRIVG